MHCSTGQYLASRVSFTTATAALLARSSVMTVEKSNATARIYPTKLNINHTLVVDLNDFISSTQKLSMSVYDGSGRLLHQQQLATGVHSVSPKDIGIKKAGLYIIRIQKGKNIFTGKLMIED